MMDSKELTQKFYREFINKYKEYPELWDPNHEHYKNKFKRNLGNTELFKVIKKYDPTATHSSVRLKINCLRSNYRKELRRHLKSRTILPNGTEAFEYIPKGWKFYALQFLNAAFVEELEDSGFEAIHSEVTIRQDLALADEMEGIQPSPEDTYNSDDGENELDNSYIIKVPANSYRKRKYKEEYENTTLSNEPPIGREFEAIGTNVAYKLERMEESQRYYAELLINKVLINGLKKNLSEETDLTDLQVLDVKTFDD